MNEKLGKYAFWLWLVGFLVAFLPLYALGLMGATRRLDHYSASTGRQPLFIAAGIGGVIIAMAVAMQVIQIIVSFRQRKQNLDTTGDPWNGRTLEWATTSPPPHYNFAIIPQVSSRDAWWEIKNRHTKKSREYEDFQMPRNTPVGIYISALLFAVGFAMVWHIWWLALFGVFGAIVVLIIRAFDENTLYTIKAEEVEEEDSRK